MSPEQIAKILASKIIKHIKTNVLPQIEQQILEYYGSTDARFPPEHLLNETDLTKDIAASVLWQVGSRGGVVDDCVENQEHTYVLWGIEEQATDFICKQIGFNKEKAY